MHRSRRARSTASIHLLLKRRVILDHVVGSLDEAASLELSLRLVLALTADLSIASHLHLLVSLSRSFLLLAVRR